LKCVVAASELVSEVPFYSFGLHSEFNTMVKLEAQARESVSGEQFETATLPCSTVNAILASHLPIGQRLDLLCLDCEGADEALLRSIDWRRHRPAVVVFEDGGITFETPMRASSVSYMTAQGYELYAKMGPSLIMVALAETT